MTSLKMVSLVKNCSLSSNNNIPFQILNLRILLFSYSIL